MITLMFFFEFLSLLIEQGCIRNYRNNYFDINLNIHEANFIKIFIQLEIFIS